MTIKVLPNERTTAAKMIGADLTARLQYWSADLLRRGLVTESAVMAEAAHDRNRRLKQRKPRIKASR